MQIRKVITKNQILEKKIRNSNPSEDLKSLGPKLALKNLS